VTVEDSMGIINPSRGHAEPASEHLLSEPAIVGRLAEATLGSRSPVDWKGVVANYDRIRDHIEHVIPGFEDFNNRIRTDVFYLPNDPRDRRQFHTPTGKATFIISDLAPIQLEPGQYLMMTVRSHDQFNTTIYGLNDRYRGVYNGRRVVFMNSDDVDAAGLQQGQLVDLTSHYEGEERVARHFMVAPCKIARGCTATYFPETNVLVPIDSTADRSNTPTSKSLVISIKPSTDAATAVGDILRNARAAAR
jgi:anaerobic selenocysteine-containing dehydrogenase